MRQCHHEKQIRVIDKNKSNSVISSTGLLIGAISNTFMIISSIIQQPVKKMASMSVPLRAFFPIIVQMISVMV